MAESNQAEAALRESEERFRSAFEHTNVAMVLTDINNRFVRVNRVFALMFGYSPSEMLGMSTADVTHADDLAESQALRDALLSGQATHFQMEKRYLHKDGHVFWGLTNVSLVRDPLGQPVQYFGQVQDITQRKRDEEALASYNRRLRILRQIDSALISGEDPAAIAATALPLLRDLLGVGRAIVNLFDLARSEVEWLAAAGRRRVRVGPGVRYSIQFMGDVEALQRGEHQLIDIRTLPPGPEVDALFGSGIHTYVVVPMIANASSCMLRNSKPGSRSERGTWKRRTPNWSR
jgi:PAS domain S-box-containing protein